MIGRLLADFDLAQLPSGVMRGALKHLHKPFLLHKVGAGRGRKIPASRQQLHRAEIDLLIAAVGGIDRLAALGKGGRVEDDKVEPVVGIMALRHLRKEIEHIGGHKAHLLLKAV